MKASNLFLIALLVSILIGCESPGPGKQVFISEGHSQNVVNGYWLYLPRNYDESKEWPVILFLQGGYGVGPDIRTSKNDGPAKFAMINSERNGEHLFVSDTFIIINPHMRTGPKEDRQWFQFSKQIDRVIEEVLTNYSTDRNRVYLTGLSRGGHGSWGISKRIPNKFAALAPVAGRISCKKNCDKISQLPMWIIHNTGDQIVEYENSASTVDDLEENFNLEFTKTSSMKLEEGQLSSSHIFTSFEKDGHDAWNEAYRSNELYEWMLRWRLE